jgi:photosystem II oxygen-evolving enhancer protein 2
MLRRLFSMLLLVLALTSCSLTPASGLKSFVDSLDGYQFLYPNGWVAVPATSGLDVVFHDIIQPTENVSVVINPVSGKKSLEELGTPGEVAYRIGKSAIAPEGSGRVAELVNAESKALGDKTYYYMEYAVKVGDQLRHSLSGVGLSRGKLYTITVSAPEARWDKVKQMMESVIGSFSVY